MDCDKSISAIANAGLVEMLSGALIDADEDLASTICCGLFGDISDLLTDVFYEKDEMPLHLWSMMEGLHVSVPGLAANEYAPGLIPWAHFQNEEVEALCQCVAQLRNMTTGMAGRVEPGTQGTLEDARALIDAAGIADISLDAVAQLYHNGVRLLALSDRGIEIASRNDWQGNLNVVDALLEDLHFSCSSGLSRYVKVEDVDGRLHLIERFQKVMSAGQIAIANGVDVR